MPVTNYHTINGRLIGETTAGVRTDYLTDALGSITVAVNESAQIINTYRYKPFGERLTKTGSGADPRFQFTGGTGSVTTARRYAENYNRRRSLDVKNGRWGSVDPLWPGETAYEYAQGNPTSNIDPTGQSIYAILCVGLVLEQPDVGWGSRTQSLMRGMILFINRTPATDRDTATILSLQRQKKSVMP